MADPRHHLHKRKRIHQKYEKYPHPDKWKRFLDVLIYVAAVFGPIVSIPQVLKIWLSQDGSGVSLITWTGYLIASLLWMVYGFAHNEKPILFSGFLWIVVEILVVIGIVVY